MRIRFIVLIALVNFILQTTLAPYVRIWGVAPNTALILTVVITMLGGMNRGLAFGLTAGLLQDLFLSKALGLHTLIYGLLALGIGLLESRLFKDNKFTPAVLVTGATFVFSMVTYFALYLADDVNSIVYVLTNRFPLEAIYNTAICLLFYRKLFSRVYGYGLR